MARASTQHGLIVTTNRHVTASLDELIVGCDWPILLTATPQRLRRQLLLGAPKISLLWIDVQSDLPLTIELLSWLARHAHAVRRIVVAYQLSSDVEVAIRCAGAQLYLAADDNISALIDAWLPMWLGRPERRTPATPGVHFASSSILPAPQQVDLGSSEPP